MNIMELFFLVIYAVLAGTLAPALIYWLIDAKKLGDNKICASVVGLALAFIWPVSIVAVHFSEKCGRREGGNPR